LKHVPLILTVLRAALGPVVVALAFFDPWPVGFGACLVIAFLSDVFDGIIARRLGVATPALRRLDSIADSIFYVAALLAAYHLHREAIIQRWHVLAILAALEAARYAFDYMKFGREASYHMWSSKAWGIGLFVGFFSLLALGADGMAVDVAIWIGIVADIEGLAISLALREWRSDVPSLVHAMKLRSVPVESPEKRS